MPIPSAFILSDQSGMATLQVAVAEKGVLDMRDPFDDVAGCASNKIRPYDITIRKEGLGAWKLGGYNIITPDPSLPRHHQLASVPR